MKENFNDFDLKNEGIILEKTDEVFEKYGVLNPTCIMQDGFLHMFYRAVAENNFSSIGYCKFKDGKLIERSNKPILSPEFEYEKHGMEDPRITFVDGVYYLFYTAYDGQNCRVAYATSPDLILFEKQGTISPEIKYSEVIDIFKEIKMPVKYIWFGEYLMKSVSNDILIWQKDVFLFPRKINGKFVLMNRVMPGIQIIYFDNFEQLKDKDFWIEQLRNIKDNVVLEPKYSFESKHIGGGSVPVETPDGWLMLYHGVEEDPMVYRAGAALLDLQNPIKCLGRLKEPLFSPAEKWEKVGAVDNVVFPSSALKVDDRLYIYYGAADEYIGLKSLDINLLVKQLKEIGNE